MKGLEPTFRHEACATLQWTSRPERRGVLLQVLAFDGPDPRSTFRNQNQTEESISKLALWKH